MSPPKSFLVNTEMEIHGVFLQTVLRSGASSCRNLPWNMYKKKTSLHKDLFPVQATRQAMTMGPECCAPLRVGDHFKEMTQSLAGSILANMSVTTELDGKNEHWSLTALFL